MWRQHSDLIDVLGLIGHGSGLEWAERDTTFGGRYSGLIPIEQLLFSSGATAVTAVAADVVDLFYF